MIYKLVVVGAQRTGKTRLVESTSRSYPTMGLHCHRVLMDGDTYCVWDTSGQRRYRDLVLNMLDGASAVFVVYRDRSSAKIAEEYATVARQKSPSAIIVGINSGNGAQLICCDTHYSIDTNYLFQFRDMLREVARSHTLKGIYVPKQANKCCCTVL